MKYIENIFGSVDSIASLLVYALIAVLFILGFIKCILPVIRTCSVLKSASRSIKSGDKKHSWQDDYFLGKGALYPHWSEYLNNLFFADGDYHNPSNVEDFINEDSVIYGPGNSGFADALPGLMVSLGFMGTLIGLATGLSGFDMGNETAIMSSIETLIPGLRYAFMTSIVGVIGSVSFTLIIRIVNGSASRAIDGFYGAMSRYAGVLSVDPMTQIAIYQQEQTTLIQNMSKEMGGQITEAMSTALRPVEDALTRFVTVNTQEQMRFLDTVVTRFVSHMDQALGGQFDGLAGVLDQTVRSQERLLKAVEGHVDGIARSAVELGQLEKTIQNTMSGMEGYVSRLSASQRQLDEAYGRVTSNIEGMQLISHQQADYLRNVGAMQNAVSGALDRIAAMTDNIAAASEQLKAAGAQLDSLRGDFKAEAGRAADELGRVHARVLGEAEDELKGIIDAMNNYQRDYNARMDEVAQAIGGSVEKLPRAVQAVSENIVDQIDRMNAALNRAQRALDEAVDRMYGN
jgi:ABC-type transporter Mla subunit MlaD